MAPDKKLANLKVRVLKKKNEQELPMAGSGVEGAPGVAEGEINMAGRLGRCRCLGLMG